MQKIFKYSMTNNKGMVVPISKQVTMDELEHLGMDIHNGVKHATVPKKRSSF